MDGKHRKTFRKQRGSGLCAAYATTATQESLSRSLSFPLFGDAGERSRGKTARPNGISLPWTEYGRYEGRTGEKSRVRPAS